jgi:DNA-binding transcriptional ArsR family regulator
VNNTTQAILDLIRERSPKPTLARRLEKHFDLSPAVISYHLNALESAGLITSKTVKNESFSLTFYEFAEGETT